MKIIQKEIWSDDSITGDDTIIGFSNNTPDYITLRIGECSGISGKFYGFCKKQKMPISHVIFSPRTEYRDYSINLDIYPPDYDEIEYFKHPERYKNYKLKSIEIPNGTCIIQLVVVPYDEVMIQAKRKKEFVLVDDNGNEIPLDQLLCRN